MSYQTLTPYVNEQDKLDRFVNGFATQSFRDQADRDYIAARLACRYELFPQFLWSSQQALEKYLKAILLYNRIDAKKVKHDINKAMQLTKKLSFEIDLSERSQKFIKLISDYGEYRYIEVPFSLYGYILVDLDLTIWELRWYCQVLDVFGKELPPYEYELLQESHRGIDKSRNEPRYKFRLHGGLLEAILDNRKHPSRPALLWNNPCFGNRNRPFVKAKWHLNAINPLLTIYPRMLDELLKFVYLPERLADAYRAHAAKADS